MLREISRRRAAPNNKGRSMATIDKRTTNEFHTGQGVAGPTPTPLPDRPVYQHVEIKAIDAIRVNNYPLAAGESVKIEVDRTGKVYVAADSPDQAFAWIAS